MHFSSLRAGVVIVGSHWGISERAPQRSWRHWAMFGIALQNALLMSSEKLGTGGRGNTMFPLFTGLML